MKQITMSFATAINCMDGRTQEPVIKYLKEHFNVQYIDTITEPGPVALLAESISAPETKSILKRIDISVEKHASKGIAIIAHHDCAGNPVDKDKQLEQLSRSIRFIKGKYDLPVIGLWVNEEWEVELIS